MFDTFDLLSKPELSRRRAPLLARIHRRYKTIDQPFDIGPLRFNFTRVADANVVLDQVCAEEDSREQTTGDRRDGNDLHLPYWAELWDSSVGVGWWLVGRGDEVGSEGVGSKKIRQQRHLTYGGSSCSFLRDPVTPSFPTPQPPRTLDLGCGMGLAGMVAAALGHQVLFADIETPALLFARLNSLPYANRVRLRRLNWQRDHLGEKFDLILGADVLYEKAQWEYLEPFWREHLAKGGTILLGEPGRQTGDLFGDWIAARGWTLTMSQQSIPGRALPIRLFQLNRAPANDQAPMTNQ